MTKPLELFAQLPVIVDFTVEDDAHGGILVPHRLRATGEVEDGQPAMPEKDAFVGVLVIPLAVRPTVCESAGHRRQIVPAATPEKACDTAHQACAKLMSSRTV